LPVQELDNELFRVFSTKKSFSAAKLSKEEVMSGLWEMLGLWVIVISTTCVSFFLVIWF